jgi:hypothetical protein
MGVSARKGMIISCNGKMFIGVFAWPAQSDKLNANLADIE